VRRESRAAGSVTIALASRAEVPHETPATARIHPRRARRAVRRVTTATARTHPSARAHRARSAVPCFVRRSFIIPREHLELAVTRSRGHCRSTGINVNQLLSRGGRKPVAHFRVNEPMGRPDPFLGRRRNDLLQNSHAHQLDARIYQIHISLTSFRNFIEGKCCSADERPPFLQRPTHPPRVALFGAPQPRRPGAPANPGPTEVNARKLGQRTT
jgi:hypothetical protein